MQFLLLKAETILGIFTVSSELYWPCVVDVVVFYGKEMIDVFCLDAVASMLSIQSILTHLCYSLETASPVLSGIRQYSNKLRLKRRTLLMSCSPARRNYRELDTIKSCRLHKL
jgi:hypothetical protein